MAGQMDNERALRLFVSVVEMNSFSQGGARLGMPQSSASRMISLMEERLGARLLQRSTRKLTLTEAGEIYFERAAKIVTELDAAAEAIRNINAAPAGLLRVSAPSAFGRVCIAPLLREFHTIHPDVSIGLALSDSVVDMIGMGYDVAIRMGSLPDSNLIASRLTGAMSLVCASPAYLRANGTPMSPNDLKRHNCLQFRTNPGQNKWSFKGETGGSVIQINGSLFADSGDALLAAAVFGLGVCFLPQWLLQPHLDSGELLPVLSDYVPADDITPIQAVSGYRKHIPAKQRVFTSFLREKLATLPWAKSKAG